MNDQVSITMKGKVYRRTGNLYEVETVRGWRTLNVIRSRELIREIDVAITRDIIRARFMEPETAPVMTRSVRKLKCGIAARHLGDAIRELSELVDSYTEESDGNFSACHPRTGLASVRTQLLKLQTALAREKV